MARKKKEDASLSQQFSLMENKHCKTYFQENTVRPEWLQLPKPPARCPVTSLSRSKLNELLLPCKANGFNPPVKSRSIRSRKGASRGIRIYSVESLLAHIEAQTAGEVTAH